jgi:hypothetical protein
VLRAKGVLCVTGAPQQRILQVRARVACSSATLLLTRVLHRLYASCMRFRMLQRRSQCLSLG